VICQPQGREGEYRKITRDEVTSLSLRTPFRQGFRINQAHSQSQRHVSGIAKTSLNVEYVTSPGSDTGAAQQEENPRAKLEWYKEELSRHRRNRDIEAEVNTLRQMGLTYEVLNEQQKAVEHYTLMLPLLQAEAQASSKASVLFKLGMLSRRMEYYAQAKDYLQQALPLSRDFPIPNFKADVHYYLGLTNSALGDNRQAYEHLRQALPIYEKLNERKRVADVYALLGQLAPTPREVFDYYSKARAAFQKLGLKKQEARMLDSIGMFYGTSDEQAALRYYRQALDIWKDVGDLAKQAQTHSYMGQLYAVLGDKPSADESYQLALRIWQSLDDRLGEADVTRSLGDVAVLLTGNMPDALRHFSRAASLWRAENKPFEEADTLISISLIQARSGQRREALDTLSRITPLIKRADTSGQRDGYLAFYIGLGYDTLNDPERALKYWQQALDIHKARGDQRGAAMVLAAMGRTHELKGERHKALAYYLESIAIREKTIEEARIEELKISLAGKSANAYHQAVLLAFKLGNHVQAFELSERARARSLLDQLGNYRLDLRRGASTELIEKEQALRLEISALQKQLVNRRALPATQQLSEAETQALPRRLAERQQEYGDLLVQLKASNPEYASLRTVDPIDLKRLQALLDESTTLLSYFSTPEQSLAFIITRNSFHAVELCTNGRCVSGRELKDAITQFRGFADLRDPHPTSLGNLYGWLIQPVREYLRTTTVCVIPHGVLHYLPFAALHSERRFLGESHNIYYLPSASVIPFVQQKQKKGEPDLLALAQDRAESLARLAYANQSADTIAKLFNTNALLGSAATESAFRSRASTSRTLFLAAHGSLSRSNPLFSRIFLAPDGENDGILEVHEVYGLDLSKADLIVLSACQTQLGEQSQGDDIVGLNRAFIYAGTPTVVASLWSVPEKETGELMVAFFKQLRSGMSKAEALQAAQREMRAKYPHPYYWAAFVLTGVP